MCKMGGQPLMMGTNLKLSQHFPSLIHDYPEGDANLWEGEETNILTGQFFPENCMIMKKFWPGGVRPVRTHQIQN